MILGLPDPRRLKRAADHALSLPRRKVADLMARRRALPVRREPIWLTNESGYRIFAGVHGPDDQLARPGVVLVPGRDQSGQAFCRGGAAVTADEIASRGFRVMHFDPVGRGRSWGHDDFCGSEGQDALRATLDHFVARRDVKRDRVGVFSFSMGLALAAPVLARDGRRLGVRFLLDWEGPADREAIVRTGALPPAARTALAANPAGFWELREPAGWIDQVPCPYVRVQGLEDHALGRRGVAGALDLVGRACTGLGGSTRLNRNAPDVAWRRDQEEQLDWAPAAAGPLNRLLLAELTELLSD